MSEINKHIFFEEWEADLYNQFHIQGIRVNYISPDGRSYRPNNSLGIYAEQIPTPKVIQDWIDNNNAPKLSCKDPKFLADLVRRIESLEAAIANKEQINVSVK